MTAEFPPPQKASAFTGPSSAYWSYTLNSHPPRSFEGILGSSSGNTDLRRENLHDPLSDVDGRRPGPSFDNGPSA